MHSHVQRVNEGKRSRRLYLCLLSVFDSILSDWYGIPDTPTYAPSFFLIKSNLRIKLYLTFQ